MNNESYVVISDVNGTPTKVFLNILVGDEAFIKHELADLAKVKIIPTIENKTYLEGRFFPYNQINIEDKPLSKDIELTTIGFPLGLGATGERFSPLTYRTFVAAPAISLPRFDSASVCDFIILELPSTGGYSGGPMFDLGYIISGMMSQTKQDTVLHGIVHGTISDQTGGKLAAITPCKYLKNWL